MANRPRGDVDLTLGGTTLTLRPTFEALCEIEDRTGLTMGEIGARALDGRLGVKHLAVIVWAGHCAARPANGDPPPALGEIGEKIVAVGYSEVARSPAVIDFLKAALGWTPGDKSPGQKKSSAKRSPSGRGSSK